MIIYLLIIFALFFLLKEKEHFSPIEHHVGAKIVYNNVFPMQEYCGALPINYEAPPPVYRRVPKGEIERPYI